MKAKGCHGNYVAIKALPVEKQEGQVLEMTEQTMDSQVKKQNRGEVIMMGGKCDPWIKVGDIVSFYRNAATVVPEEDGELLLVHEDHVLVKF